MKKRKYHSDAEAIAAYSEVGFDERGNPVLGLKNAKRRRH